MVPAMVVKLIAKDGSAQGIILFLFPEPLLIIGVKV
jgi:hypothetical protein